MKKSIIFGVLAMFAVSALSIQNVNAQDNKSVKPETKQEVGKEKKVQAPANEAINQPKGKVQPDSEISTTKGTTPAKPKMVKDNTPMRSDAKSQKSIVNEQENPKPKMKKSNTMKKDETTQQSNVNKKENPKPKMKKSNTMKKDETTQQSNVNKQENKKPAMKKSNTMKKDDTQTGTNAKQTNNNGKEQVFQKQGVNEKPNNVVKPKMKTDAQQNEQGTKNAEK